MEKLDPRAIRSLIDELRILAEPNGSQIAQLRPTPDIVRDAANALDQAVSYTLSVEAALA